MHKRISYHVYFDIYFLYRSFLHLGAGLAVGLSGLAAGFAIGIVGDAGVRGTAQQPRLFVGKLHIQLSPKGNAVIPGILPES